MTVAAVGTPSLLTLLKLGRVSNLPTVWTDVLAGALLSGGAWHGWRIAVVLLAMTLFYTGGMYLNDYFDRAIDTRERPERPIPAQEISPFMVAAIGAGLMNAPHGFHIDRDGNVWVADGNGPQGRGHAVYKLSPDGKVLMTLGKPNSAGAGDDEFNAPSDVVTAPNGDIFVADGHGEKTNARIVKFSKDGKFIKTWGKEGKGPGEFNQPHGIAMDSQGRLFVADRANSRIQIFDQDGKFLTEWKQFGRPSGVVIDKNDVIHVADSQSTAQNNPGFQQGIRVGSAKDGKVTAFIPETVLLGALETVGFDDAGNVYAGYTNKMDFKRWVKK